MVIAWSWWRAGFVQAKVWGLVGAGVTRRLEVVENDDAEGETDFQGADGDLDIVQY